ncbi:hypothetical protein YB2330_000040 [Saitoella coloradoensis]
MLCTVRTTATRSTVLYGRLSLRKYATAAGKDPLNTPTTFPGKAALPPFANGSGKDPLNAPSTFPPKLDLPPSPKPEDMNRFTWLRLTGKGYLVFYKTAFKTVWSNYKESKALQARPEPKNYTRAEWQLIRRARPDTIKLPFFALLLLICGEFTPLVTYFVPSILPNVALLPWQEKQRIDPLAIRKARLETKEHQEYLRQDNAMIDMWGGVKGLNEQEVMRALLERGHPDLDSVPSDGVDSMRKPRSILDGLLALDRAKRLQAAKKRPAGAVGDRARK